MPPVGNKFRLKPAGVRASEHLEPARADGILLGYYERRLESGNPKGYCSREQKEDSALGYCDFLTIPSAMLRYLKA